MASRIDQDMGSQRAGGTLEDGLVTGAELDTLLRRRASELVASQNQARQRNLIPEQLSARIGEESYGLPLTSVVRIVPNTGRSEGHTAELQSLMRLSFAVFCLKKTH